MNEKSIKGYIKIIATIVSFLALASFVISFDATAHEAGERFATGNLKYLVPFVIEGALLSFLAWSFLRSTLGESRKIPFMLVSVFTTLSVAINVSHARFTGTGFFDNLLTGIMAAVPPIALFLSVEALVSILETSGKRSAQTATLAELKATIKKSKALVEELNTAVSTKQKELEAVNESLAQAKEHRAKMIADMEAQISSETDVLRKQAQRAYETEYAQLTAKLDALRDELAQAETEQLDLAKQMLLVYVANHPDATQAEISRVIGKSPSTVSKYINELKENKMLHKNGHGFEVLV